mmetsp:Transcript_10884/g.16047  ORF Transcript_10884/g.16047 Transcript_10884/m.16047 type:complete len:147 (+) Transcript_10884:104-544(+)
MLRHHHSNDTHCLVTPGERHDNIITHSRTQVRSNDDVLDDTLLLKRTQTDGSPNKEDSLDKVKSSEHKLLCESNLTRTMESLQTRVIKQEIVNDFPQHPDFLEMTRPRKNGRKRTSTEYHISKFVPCFENMTDDIDLDDMSIEEEE